jgi:hypothetical protein
MDNTLYFFNPDHDLALANGDENFNAPISAKSFGEDLKLLPVWYAFPEGIVCGGDSDNDWMVEMQYFFPQLIPITSSILSCTKDVRTVHPWGWNRSVRKYFMQLGIPETSLPDNSVLEKIRRLSHRSLSIQALEFLREDEIQRPVLPVPARLLSAGEVESFALKHPSVVFKAPWSGSGKGLYWTSSPVSKSIQGWCGKIAKQQGCVIGEEAYNKLQDFAMEFLCKGGDVLFAGYSLFETDHGTYKSNELLSDEMIYKRLTVEWVSSDVLTRVQSRLKAFIRQEIAPIYNGYLGVDMMVYKKDGRFMLHPCVEINLRMTMGLVARMFYDRFVLLGQTGRFVIDHFSEPGSLKQDHIKRMSDFPLVVEDGRIVKGYITLTPVLEHTFYRIRVEIQAGK